MYTSRAVAFATITLAMVVLVVTYVATEFRLAEPQLAVLLPPPASAPPAPTPPTPPPSPPSWDAFYDLLDTRQPCNLMRKFGGQRNSDGAKMVCLDPGLAPRPEGDCTVLSFGINTDWSFDDAMAAHGCQVHAFDPSLDTPDHLRGHRVHFYQLGIGDSWKSVKFRRRVGQLAPYAAILRRLNATDDVIDYLKMDTEGAEIQFFDDVFTHHPALLDNVKQIGMEIHPGRDAARRDRLWAYIRRLRARRFRQIYSQPNSFAAFTYNKRRVSAAFELVWVNDAFKAPSDGVVKAPR